MKKLLSVIALVGFGLAAAQSGFTLPAIPSEIAVPEGQKVALVALGRGTQNYACQANAAQTGFEWAFKAPEANLFDASNTKIASHFGGPTWEAPDGSRVVGEVKARVASPNTIPWLLLSAKSTAGTGLFGKITFIQRLATTGGSAPSSGCDATSTVGSEARMTYTSLYVFFEGK
jgi:Protein of unknown function (DUF3455)